VAQIKAQADLMKAQMTEQSKAQQEMAKMQAEMVQFREEMRLKWAELAATETVAEDKAIVERAKVLAGVAKDNKPEPAKPNGGGE
jgi:hypothetical protein